MPSSPDMVYRVDSEDRIEFVNDVWDAFAHDSNTDSLSSASVLKHSLWDYISDRTTRGIYKAMLTKARGGRPVEFTFRCDAPELRREYG
jgi:hypothetical protein